MHDALVSAVVYLAAAVVAVPIFQRLRLGAILGYLTAGIAIGPHGLALATNPEETLHFAELGVVLLLFVIGLELSPATLWRMRNWILLLGNFQLFATAAVIVAFVMLVTTNEVTVAGMIGLALALSSTAFAVQLMTEYRILNTPLGQKGFSILLLQDLAVIPILLYVAALGGGGEGNGTPIWLSLAAVAGVLVAGYFLLNPSLRIVSRYGNSELMTAAALLIVLGIALLIETAGLSLGMGAFIAGILLANSSFRHQLETDVEPFKGILLGLFFIAVGMMLDIERLFDEFLLIFALAIGLMVLKTVVIASIARLTGSNVHDSIRIALMLSQGGEFAFVVMTQALASGVIEQSLADLISLIVGVSMALTSPLISLYNRLLAARSSTDADYDTTWDEHEPEVIIAGFGRVGQITGRILTANGVRFTALDRDAEHIEFVEQFGNKVFFGDATRLDLLETAGIRAAKVLLVAVDDEEDALAIVRLARHECPHLKIISRAHNRTNLLQQKKAGADVSRREVYESSVSLARDVMQGMGMAEDEAGNLADIFLKHDRSLIEEALKRPIERDSLIEIGVQGRLELERLFEQDKKGRLG